jgi:hypothetical protein
VVVVVSAQMIDADALIMSSGLAVVLYAVLRAGV